MKHVIDIQDYGGNRVARLLPAFRIRFDENNIQVNLLIIFLNLFISGFLRPIWNNLIV
jgi:hypothetical protein